MLSIKSPIVPSLVLAILFLTASTASADPITAGSLTFSGSSPSPFSLSGPGLAMNGTSAQLISSVSLLSNGLFVPGGSGMTGGSVDSQDGELELSTPLTVGGVLQSPNSTLLILRFSSSSFVVPVGPTSGFVVIAPFSLTSGLVEGYAGLPGDVPLFSGVFRLQSQTFVFGATVQGVSVQSIPEPTSVMLIFSGILAFAGYRKRTSS
jgi:hypothetical protein